jgi:[acyl-carrier-protein] S-malonyltransferase
MQEAVPVGVGAMAAILGMDLAPIEAIVAEVSGDGSGEVCAIANLNGPAQTVIAGHAGAVDRAIALARERGARKATMLTVSAPFHSPLMRPAREGMAGPLAAAAFHDPRIPVVSNVDAEPVTTGAAARDALLRQIDGAVRWVESIRWMEEKAGVETFVEVGVGTVLSGMNRRIVGSATTTGIADPEQLAKLLAPIEGEIEPDAGADGKQGGAA